MKSNKNYFIENSKLKEKIRCYERTTKIYHQLSKYLFNPNEKYDAIQIYTKLLKNCKNIK